MGGGRTGRPRARSRALLVLALYAIVVAVTPAFHHDVACHLTSPMHCTACTSTVAAARAEQTVVVLPASLPLAGQMADRDDDAPQGVRSLRIPARAPPA